MSNSKETFEWYYDGEDRVLPVDYLRREFARLINRDPRGVTKNLIEHTLFKSCLYMVLPDGAETKKATAIPLEASQFLASFYQVSSDPRFHAAFLNVDIDKGETIDQNLFQAFMQEFCRDLAQRILPPKNQSGTLENDESNSGSSLDNNAFCRHILFDNNAFTEITMDELFARELKKRYMVLVERGRSATTADKAEMLEKCLLAIDQVLMEFDSGDKDSQRKIYTEKDLQNMLAQILKKREGALDSRAFRIKNSPLSTGTTKTMEEGFAKINNYRKKGDEQESLKTAVRAQFLSDLAATAQTSEFEKAYIKLVSYLDTRDSQGEEDLFVQELKRACIPIIEYCCFDCPDLDGAEPAYPVRYIDMLTTSAASKDITDTCRIFLETMDTVRQYRMIRYTQHNTQIHARLSGIGFANLFENESAKTLIICTAMAIASNQLRPSAPRNSGYNIYYDEVCQFADFFQVAWNSLRRKDEKIFDKQYHLVDRIGMAELFAEHSVRAANFLDCPDVFPYTADQIAERLKVYEQIIQAPDYLAPYGKVLEFVPVILTGLVLQLLMRIVKDSLSRRKKLAKLLTYLRELPF